VSYASNTAERYRAFAEELRIIADWDRVENNRRKLLDVAENYDEIAMTMEAINDTNKRTGRWQQSESGTPKTPNGQ
jgi:hypothetical protein